MFMMSYLRRGLGSILVLWACVGLGNAAGEGREYLGLTLSADRHSLSAGDSVTLTTMLSSDNPRPVNVRVGSTSGGVPLRRGGAFQVWYSMHADGPYAPAEAIRHVGYCGTGARSLYVGVRRGAPVVFDCLATLERLDEDTVRLVLTRPGASRWEVEYQLPWPCSVTIQATHSVIHGHREPDTLAARWIDRFYEEDAFVVPPEPMAPFWIGELKSNHVVMELGRIEKP